MVFALLSVPVSAGAATIADFVGSYKGTADILLEDGTTQKRDMSVDISETKKGFKVEWSSITYKSDGRAKEKTYSVDFIPTDRSGVFAAAMRKNVFGHEVQLDPMKGEPYVWSHLHGDTLTVFSLFVDEQGEYEMQQFSRTLAEGGLQLEFSSVRNGEKQRMVSTFLKRQ